MKVIASIFVILPLVASAITAANAFDAKSFFAEQERQSGGGTGGG
jgi:hypothetical protein